MNRMFEAAIVFDRDISKWKIQGSSFIHGMFDTCLMKEKHRPLGGGWDVSSVTSMYGMFRESPFNGDISRWQISDSCNTLTMFKDCPIPEEHRPSKRK